jgi:hypothetical protein
MIIFPPQIVCSHLCMEGNALPFFINQLISHYCLCLQYLQMYAM